MYEFGRFRFDPENHLLLSEGTPVSLTPKAFDILLVLVQNGSRLTTKEELMRKVWPDSFVEEANLTVNISALRKVLGETADGQSYIDTVPKKGYRFATAVTEVREENPPQALPLEEQSGKLVSKLAESNNAISSIAAKAETVAKGKPLHYLAISALCLLVVTLVVAGYLALGNRSTRGLSPTQPRRLAVLPFQNLRANAESDFLGFSLADAVITKLGYVSELAVRPSYAVQKYKNETIDIRKVSSELNVDALLTGTFLREGDDLRITCQLIDIRAETILWKKTFDVKYDKLLTVQDSVANQIIKGLELSLSPSEAARLKQEKQINGMAYEYYLRGVDLYSMNDFPMAIKMLERSTELAPDYALSWANLGKAFTANASFQFGGGEQYQKAQKAFEQALALQADQIDARVYMANMFTDTGRVEQAVPLLREALKTNPNHPEIHWELSYAYRFGGILQQSVFEAETARRLDPVVKLNSSTLNGYLYLGRYDQFLASLPKTNDLALIAFYRGFGEYYKRNWEQATKQFDRALELDHSLFQAQIGKALNLGIRHNEKEGIGVLHEMETKINERGVGDPEAIYKMAQAYAALGDTTSALRMLRNSIEGGFFPYPYFVTDPLLNSLRKDPEFQGLMNRARLRHEAFRRSFF